MPEEITTTPPAAPEQKPPEPKKPTAIELFNRLMTENNLEVLQDTMGAFQVADGSMLVKKPSLIIRYKE